MPWAGRRDTAQRWATDRAIGAWAIVAGDHSGTTLASLARTAATLTDDGAAFVLVLPPAAALTPAEAALATRTAHGGLAPAPTGLFAAVGAAGLDDVRRLGILAGTPSVVDAARRAGVGAVIAIDPDDDVRRQELLEAQPDAIVAADGFAAHETTRYGSRRALRERVLLNPGPAVVSDRVHRAVGGPDLCHREPEAQALFDRIRRKLLVAAGAPSAWRAALLGASGTGAMEAMVGGMVRPGRRLLVCRNGYYGDRLATIASRLGIATVQVVGDPDEPIDVGAVRAVLAADPAIDAVAVVQHETTTGVLNPVELIARVADTFGVLTLVDAISALPVEPLDVAVGVDVVAGTANKCLHGLPGVSFLLLSPRAVARIEAVPARSLYFDVAAYLAPDRSGGVPYTPPIPALYGLDAALDELADEGVGVRRRAYSARMAVLDAAFDRLGLRQRVRPEHRSSSVRSLALPEGISYLELHDSLRTAGYVIYAGLGPAAQSSFRVCALGALGVEALEGFVDVLAGVLAGHTAVRR